MLTFGVAERRHRLVRRHHLAPDAPAEDVEAAVAGMLALHATDPATVYMSVLARCPDATLQGTTAALYDTRELVRMIAMRRTMFVVPSALVPVLHSAACVPIAHRLRRQLVKDLRTGPTDPPLGPDVAGWLADVEDSTERALAARGEATASQLAADEPRLRTAQLPTTDKRWDIRRNVTTRVLTLMGAEGRIVRGRPRGPWTSRHHTWEPATRWWPAGIPVVPETDARATLARRWLEVFGPATVADLQWWTGWSLGTTRKALADVDTVDVDLGGVPGVVLADDVATVEPAVPSAVLLPALDPTPMGWQQREWFLGPHRGALFDRFGNVGPTVWWDGRVVGGWAVHPSGEIVWRLLEDAGVEAASGVEAAAEGLTKRLDGAVVVPSFRTPLERELSSGSRS